MGGTTDTLKGRIKEAVGVITNEDHLKREGRMDQKIGKAKDAASKVARKVKASAEKAAEAATKAADSALKVAEDAADDLGKS